MAQVSPEVAVAITRRKARYARYADTKQWDKFEALNLPTAAYAFLDNTGKPLAVGSKALVFESPKPVADYFRKFFAAQDTMHNIGPGDFEQVAPGEVKAVWGFEDQIISKHLGSWAKIRGGGYYYETWRLVDGEWYIADLRMERRYQEETLLVRVGLALANLFGFSF